jgi:hypothetical protein
MSYEVYALNPPPRRGSGISPYALNPFATPSQAMAAAYKRFDAYKPKSAKAKAIWAKKTKKPKAKKRKQAKNPARRRRAAKRPLFGFRPTYFSARTAPMGSTLGIAPSHGSKNSMSLLRGRSGRFKKRARNGSKRKRPCAGAIASALKKSGCPTAVVKKAKSGKVSYAEGLEILRKTAADSAAKRLERMKKTAWTARGSSMARAANPKRKRRKKKSTMRHRNFAKGSKWSKAARAKIMAARGLTGKKRKKSRKARTSGKRKMTRLQALAKARAARKRNLGKFTRVSLPKRRKPKGAKRWTSKTRLRILGPAVHSLPDGLRQKVVGSFHRAGYQNPSRKRRSKKRHHNGRKHFARRHRNPGLVVAVKDQTSKLLSMSFGKSVLAVGAGFVAASQLPIMLSKVAKKDLTSGPVGVVTSALSAAVASAVAIQVAPGSANAIMIGGGLEVLFRLVAALAPSQSAMIEGPSVAKVDAAMARVSGGVKDYVMLSGYDGSVSTNMGFPVLTGEDLIRGQAAGPGVRDYVDVGMNDYVGVGGEAEKYGSETF